MIASQVIQGVPLGGSRPSSLVEDDLDNYIHVRRARSHRRWVIRASLSLVLTAAILCIVVIVRRDQMTVTTDMAALANAQKALQVKIDAWGRLPAARAVLPELPKGHFYIDDSERFYAMHATEPVIVAAAPQTLLTLRSDGHCVIIYEQQKVRTEWMTRADFVAARRTQLNRLKAFRALRRSIPPDLP